MRLLITGANGQLGKELQHILKKGQSALGSVPLPLRDAAVTSVDVDVLDITDLSAVSDFTKKIKPDVIINCAAFTDVNGCETQHDVAMRVNAIGPRNLAIAAQDIGAKLIHVSTDYVFSGQNKTSRVEWDICAPQSIYGYSKYLGEQYVREMCTRYFVVRTAWLYGYVGHNFVKTILKLALERDAIKVVNDQYGNPTNAEDLAHHLLKLADSESYGIYHCTNQGVCSWYDFASEFTRLAGLACTISPCTTDEYPTPAKRPAYSALDNQMLRCTVGDDMRTWQDAIKAYMIHYDQNTGEMIR
jgi:dTDP-4-dehydrorhamnose reductase